MKKPKYFEIAQKQEALEEAAVKVCRAINPDNPIKAAENMLQAIEALKKIANWEFDIIGDCVAEARQLARRAFLDVTDRE